VEATERLDRPHHHRHPKKRPLSYRTAADAHQLALLEAPILPTLLRLARRPTVPHPHTFCSPGFPPPS